ncbi:MAG: TolC family protein [Bacteroidales bacterium]|jgi:outer membrane protein TolC|nr:TolC family protein [Bacteroidales bacterium]
MRKRLLTILLLAGIPMCSLMAQQKKTDTIHINLDKAIEIALSENPTMRIAGRDIEIKKNYKKEQIALLFPTVSGAAGYNHTIQKQKMAMDISKMTSGIAELLEFYLSDIYKALWELGKPIFPKEPGGEGSNGPMEVGSFNNWSAGINFSLPIIAPAAWVNLKLSQLDVEMAMENARSSKIALINEVKKSYYNYLLAKDSYFVLQRNYENLQLSYEDISRKFEHGIVSELEKMRAEVQLNSQIPGLKSAERGIELTLIFLKVLIGVDITEAISFEGALINYEEKIKETPLPDVNALNFSNNPDINKLDIAAKQLNTSIKLLKASSSPVLALSGAWQYSAMSDDLIFKDYKWFPYSYITLGVNIPITSWTGTTYKIRSSKLNIKTLEDQKKYLDDNLKISVINSINQINNAVEVLESNKNNMLLAEKVYTIFQKQYEIGMATWLDLNSSEMALTGAKLAYNQSIYIYLTAFADLEKTLGK